MAAVGQIRVYPIKGLDPVRVERASVLASGALAFDRRWAFVDSRGRYVNGKNWPEVHRLRVEFDLARREVSADGRTFSLDRQRAELEQWCSDRLGDRVTLEANAESGFPDDTASPGPTFVSTASLEVVAGWFGFSLEEARRRFRTNIEVSDVEAFWEDRLYRHQVSMGGVVFDAVNPCARCVVPSRHPFTGDVLPGFQRQFAALREAHLPASVDAGAFDHYYRFTVNTRLRAAGVEDVIREGDDVDGPLDNRHSRDDKSSGQDE